MNVHEFLRADQENLEAIAGGLAHFARVMPLIDDLYSHSIALVHAGTEAAAFCGQSLLLWPRR